MTPFVDEPLPQLVNSPTPCFEPGAAQFLLERRYDGTVHDGDPLPFLLWVIPEPKIDPQYVGCGCKCEVLYRPTRQSLHEWTAVSGASLTGLECVCACIGRLIE